MAETIDTIESELSIARNIWANSDPVGEFSLNDRVAVVNGTRQGVPIKPDTLLRVESTNAKTYRLRWDGNAPQAMQFEASGADIELWQFAKKFWKYCTPDIVGGQCPILYVVRCQCYFFRDQKTITGSTFIVGPITKIDYAPSPDGREEIYVFNKQGEKSIAFALTKEEASFPRITDVEKVRAADQDNCGNIKGYCPDKYPTRFKVAGANQITVDPDDYIYVRFANIIGNGALRLIKA